MMTDLTPEKDGKVNHGHGRRRDPWGHGGLSGRDHLPAAAAQGRGHRGAKPKEKVKELTPEEKRANEIAAFKAQTKNQVTLITVGAAAALWR